MASATKTKPIVFCVGSPTFDPDVTIDDDAAHERALGYLAEDNDLAAAIRTWFRLPDDDTYVYHAIASVTLAQAQAVVAADGGPNVSWYDVTDDCDPAGLPTPVDVAAYTAIFAAGTTTASALKSLAANARRGSVRAAVAAHLTTHRFLHPAHSAQLTIPRAKSPRPAHRNPYFDFWAWSCRHLNWGGPLPLSSLRARSHHVLPVFMHHFACAVPSHEALSILVQLAGPRQIVDAGSGSGYWTFMLRRYGARAVVAVDSAQSAWRTTWVRDTVRADGARWLARAENDGGREMVLLMV